MSLVAATKTAGLSAGQAAASAAGPSFNFHLAVANAQDESGPSKAMVEHFKDSYGT